MVKTEGQIRAQLQAEANAAIEELLQWGRSTETPDLTQMEDKVLWLRDRLGQRMLQLTVEGQEAGRPEEAPRCPECGEPMRCRGQRARYVESRLGTLRVARGHYHCARCEGGLFPLGEGRWSEGPVREAVWLSGQAPFEHVEEEFLVGGR